MMNDNFLPYDQITPQDVLEFWFAEGSQENWWDQSDVFDDLIRSKFIDLWEAARDGKLDHWGTENAESALALIILLDQFSRNLNRNSPNAFAQDTKALKVADEAIDRGYDMDVEREPRQFFYMPYMHSEDLRDQIRCVHLMQENVGQPQAVLYAEQHMEVIEKFGRFPHRNKVLGRETSIAELAWLDQHGGF